MALEKSKQPYDRILLIVISLLAIALCGWFIWNALNFSELFAIPGAVKSTKINDPGFEALAAAKKDMTEKRHWTSPVVKGKPVDLMVSVPLVQKGSELFDMYMDDKLLRPPVANTWLLKNKLPYERDDVFALDTDRDGFSNMEEWEAKTSPSDVKSHPDYATKLELVEVKAFPVTIQFRDGGDTDFQVTVISADKTKQNSFMTPAFIEGESQFGKFRDEKDKKRKRFQGLAYVPAQGDQPAKMKIRDLQRNEDFEVVRGQQDSSRTDYDAVFEFKMMGYGPELKQLRDGEAMTLNLPNSVTLHYKLVDISAQQGSIQPLDDQGKPTGDPIVKSIKR